MRTLEIQCQGRPLRLPLPARQPSSSPMGPLPHHYYANIRINLTKANGAQWTADHITFLRLSPCVDRLLLSFWYRPYINVCFWPGDQPFMAPLATKLLIRPVYTCVDQLPLLTHGISIRQSVTFEMKFNVNRHIATQCAWPSNFYRDSYRNTVCVTIVIHIATFL